MRIGLYFGPHGDLGDSFRERIESEDAGMVTETGFCICQKKPSVDYDIVLSHPHAYPDEATENALEIACLTDILDVARQSPNTQFYVLAMGHKRRRETLGGSPNIRLCNAPELSNIIGNIAKKEKEKR